MKTETKPKPKVPKIPAAHDSRAPALAVEAWPVDRPKPYAKNPRRNDAAVEKVAASIREFGWAQPIVVDGDGVIIIGHTRLKAAKKLGLATVPVLVRSDLTPEQVAALRLADNKTAELAEWDEPLLAAELDALVGAVDMEQFGFLSVSPDDFGTDFSLPDGDKAKFGEMTFTVTDEQRDEINRALSVAYFCDGFDCEDNANKNGAGLLLIVRDWIATKITKERSFEEIESDYKDLRKGLCEALKKSGRKASDVDALLGTNGMAGHYFGESQFMFPTREAFEKLKTILPLEMDYEKSKIVEREYHRAEHLRKIAENEQGS